jgi:hypothetical protein
MPLIEQKLKIEDRFLKTIKNMAKIENTTESKIINDLLEKGIESTKTKNKIPDYLIANKNTYNPDSERIKEMIGIIETDEPFEVAKAIDEIRTRKY